MTKIEKELVELYNKAKIQEYVMSRQRKSCGKPYNFKFKKDSFVECAYPIVYVQVISDESEISDNCFTGIDIITGEKRNDWIKSAFFEIEK